VNGSTRPDPEKHPERWTQWAGDALEAILANTEATATAFSQHCRDCEANRKEIWQAITTNKLKIAGWLGAGGVAGGAVVALIKWLEH
jgi:hypothetical protein